jgi:hypothetical protein
MSSGTTSPLASSSACASGGDSKAFGSELFRLALPLLPLHTLHATLPSLLFRLSQDGAGGSAAFHRMCDGMGKTVSKRGYRGWG